MAGHVRVGTEVEIPAGELAQFADAQPGLDHEHEHGLIASAEPGVGVWGGEEGVDLVGLEVIEISLRVPFGWDREDELDRPGVLGVSERREPEQ